METGKELYRKYKGRLGKGMYGVEGPVIGWTKGKLIIETGAVDSSWTAFGGYKSVGGTVHIPDRLGSVRVNVITEGDII